MSWVDDDDTWPSSVLLRFEGPFGSVWVGDGYTLASVKAVAWLM